MQRNMFPKRVKAIGVEPAPARGAVGSQIARGANGNAYFIKPASQQYPTVPANEWVCSELAWVCGVPTPDKVILEMPDGSHAFGSEWQKAPITVTQQRLSILRGDYPDKAVIAADMAKILALDRFVHNDDRHGANYLALDASNGYIVRPIDHSHAFLAHGWPLPHAGNQARIMAQYKGVRGTLDFDTQAASDALHDLVGAPDNLMEQIVDPLPDEWFDGTMKNTLSEWWAGDRRHQRINEIRKELLHD